MFRPQRRLAIAGVAIATAIAVPSAALAAGPGSAPGKPTPPAKSSAASAKKSPAAAQSQLTALAASAGITVSQLEAGLRAVKLAGGDTAAGVAAFAAATGVSQATAQRVVKAVAGPAPIGKTDPGRAPGMIKSATAAQSDLTALAASAGISLSQLETGLRAMKQAGGSTAAGIAAFETTTGVSHATAQRVVNAVTGG